MLPKQPPFQRVCGRWHSPCSLERGPLQQVTYHTFLLHAGLWYEHRGLPFVRLGVMPFVTLHRAYVPTHDSDIWDQLSPAFALGSLF